MRIMGRRQPASSGSVRANHFWRLVIQLRGNKPLIRRGVHRFHSHQDKDAWTLRMLTRPNSAHPH